MAAHKFKLLALVARRRKKIIFWGWGVAYLAQRFNQSFDENPKTIFGGYFSNPKKDVLGQKKGIIGVCYGEFLAQIFP